MGTEGISVLKERQSSLPDRPRQLQIQDHHIGRLLAEAFETLHSIRGDPDFQRVGLEQALERPLHRTAVLDDQDCFH